MARPDPVTDLDDDTLVQRLAEAKQSLFNLRFRHVTGQQENTASFGATRRSIARIHTELRKREIAAAEALNEGEA